MLRAAKVSFRDKIAGQLEETTSGGTRFVYHAGWKETIACCLPVAKREHEWSNGLHPFFQHLGAEGWLRERQARVAHVSEEDDFGLLLKYGSDCIGAVGIPLETTQSPATAFSAADPNPGRTISGVQRKVLVVRDEAAAIFRPASATGQAPYIAKFNSLDLPTLVRNEYLSLRWCAAVLGADEVTAFTLDQIAELDETALVVTRFDRTPTGEKLRAEDFAQVLAKPRGQNYAGKYDSSYEEVANVIKEYSSRPEVDLARLFRRLVVFALVANADAHLKNFTLLERPEGLRLSPIYDVVNVGIYGGFDQNLALAIAGDRVPLERVTQPLLAAFGLRIGLSDRAIAGIFRDLKTKVRQAEKVLAVPAAEGPEGFISRYVEVVRNACSRILEA
jgi:serine/threonine-protein kinase HipA